MKPIIWVVDDDSSIRWVMEKALIKAGFNVRTFAAADALLLSLDQSSPDTVISDIRMPGIDGLQLLERITSKHPGLPIVITTAHSDLDSAVAAYQGGAFEYLPKPFDIDELVTFAQRAVAFRRDKTVPGEGSLPIESAEIIGEAPAMQEVFRAIGRLAHSDITVLINGESGTGKELVARALHRHSPKGKGPFIALNMAAIPHDLIESELFGHEKGAFTGATQRRIGHFEQAEGGTLFLDEIGDMPAEAQTRLLRVLSDNEFFRVGGHSSVKANVRIIAATHQNLEHLVEQHRFREDLFHRLNVIRIQLPGLADRREDIPKLMRYFFQQYAEELNVEPKILSAEAELYLVNQQWPGNVRQLQNTCRRLTVMAAGREILLADLPAELRQTEGRLKQNPTTWECDLRNWVSGQLSEGKKNILAEAIPAFERILIESALQHTAGRKREAAELLGWGRNTLTRKLQELNIQPLNDD
jgi:two-component system, NtrC family, nitrogen regulation response regulator GlnG